MPRRVAKSARVGLVVLAMQGAAACGMTTSTGQDSSTTTSTSPPAETTVTTAQTVGEFIREPAEGPAGTRITILGKGCTADEVFINLTTVDRQQGLGASRVPVTDDGSWSGTLVVGRGGDPDVEYHLNASCANGDAIFFEYGFQPFDLTATETAPLPQTG